MLRHLHVKNLAVIEEVHVDFGRGLHVLTGETGAGKSLVVDSLALLSGARASNDAIRTGADTLSVTGVFTPAGRRWRRVLEDAGLEADEAEVVVRREVSRSGRNRVFVDDHPVTLRLLTRLAPHLLRIHGQREELGLVAPDLQRAWLDRLGRSLDGDKAQALFDAVATAYREVEDLNERLERMTSDDRARQERIDLLRFQASEIAGAGLRAGEEVELRTERDVLRHAEAIGEALSFGADALLEGQDAIGAQAARVKQKLERLIDIDPTFKEWLDELREIRVRAEELGATMRDRRDDLEADPARLNGVEDRLALLERLLRKYGGAAGDTESVIEHERAVRAELLEIEGNDQDVAELQRKVEVALGEYAKQARRLNQARERWGKELETRMRGQLGELALPNAELVVKLVPRARTDSPLEVDGVAVEMHAWGTHGVVFEFTSNPGEEARALSKVASGGELSRLYLALQLATDGAREEAAGSVLVFDEIDTGVGGAEAAAIGSKMRALAAPGQVLAVTHLPQVASHGDEHLRVEKQTKAGRTITGVRRLDESARVEELARMLGGAEVTEVTRRHARELLGLDGGDRRGLHSVG